MVHDLIFLHLQSLLYSIQFLFSSFLLRCESFLSLMDICQVSLSILKTSLQLSDLLIDLSLFVFIFFFLFLEFFLDFLKIMPIYRSVSNILQDTLLCHALIYGILLSLVFALCLGVFEFFLTASYALMPISI